MGIRDTDRAGRDEGFKSPQPPPTDELGPCHRCQREGGITIFGTQRPPQQAVLHPRHIWVERNTRGHEEKTLRDPHPEALCSYHVELNAWETARDQRERENARLDPKQRRPWSYPQPRWVTETGALTEKHLGGLLADLTGKMTQPARRPRAKTADQVADDLERYSSEP